MLGTGRSYLGFFLRAWGLTALGGRHGTWFSRKKVTIKGCLERGPRRPTKPIQPADSERSEVGRGRGWGWGEVRGCTVLKEVMKQSTDNAACDLSKAATSFCLHVKADAQVAAGLEEPVVGGGGHVEGQPALLTCSHRLDIQEHQLWLPRRDKIEKIGRNLKKYLEF